jgi:hypothetical protein
MVLIRMKNLIRQIYIVVFTNPTINAVKHSQNKITILIR